MANLRLHSLNDVKLIGRLTRDPELRYTAQGTPVCHFRIAVSRSYKDRNSSEWKEEVAFIPCSVWRETAERCGQRLKKGSPVFVEGRLKSREWQTKEGQKRSDLEVDILRIQFLEMMGEGVPTESVADDASQESAPAPVGVGAGSSSSQPAAQFNDDEVPF
ncbi:MAG: Single-stranded DNA-binding protein [Elusimicrobia bacterium]|nr:Single-stranded DNA-binding protein [Elusimicrobiota bacterium]